MWKLHWNFPSVVHPKQLKRLRRMCCWTLRAHVYGRMDQSICIADVCVVMMGSNNATALPFSFLIIYCAYRPRRVECFQLLWHKTCAKSALFFPRCFSERTFKGGKSNTCCHSCPAVQMGHFAHITSAPLMCRVTGQQKWRARGCERFAMRCVI